VRLWRWCWVIAILQAIDLGTTYAILLLGGREGNAFIGTSLGRPSPRRLIRAAYVVVAAYVFVAATNVITLLNVVPRAR
jgi:hypothetical protein